MHSRFGDAQVGDRLPTFPSEAARYRRYHRGGVVHIAAQFGLLARISPDAVDSQAGRSRQVAVGRSGDSGGC